MKTQKTDTLKRENFVKMLVDIVRQFAEEKKGTTFAINGSWGCGKTFVLEKLEKEISSLNLGSTGFFVCKYNCWERDYYKEPLYAILSNVLDSTKEYKSSSHEYLRKETEELIFSALTDIGNNIINKFFGVNFKETLARILKRDKEFDLNFEFNAKIFSIRESIKDLAATIPIIFIVDELDRCLPGYAIKVLERLHHLFYGVENIIVIIGIDQTQLDKSVLSIFGVDTDTERYMKKFVDFSICLDNGELDDVWFSEFEDIYFKQFKTNENEYTSLKELLTSFMKCLNVREQEKTITKAIVLHKILKQRIKSLQVDEFVCVFEFLCLLFKDYLNPKSDYNWLMKYNTGVLIGSPEKLKHDKMLNDIKGLAEALELLKSKGVGNGSGSIKYFKNDGVFGKFLYGIYSLSFSDAKIMLNSGKVDVYTGNFNSINNKLYANDMDKYGDFIKEVKIVTEMI